MPASEETWAEVKRAYTDTRETQVSIAARAGVSYRAIYNKAQKEGWVRPGMTPRFHTPISAKALKADRKPGESLYDQLNRIARTNLDLLEQYMSSGLVDVGSPEHERVVRVTGAVTGVLGKLGELEGVHGRGADAARAGRTGADIERRRHEIAARLERILEKRLAEESSGGSAV